MRSFHCEWGGVTAWTEPQRLCNAAPQRTSIQLYYQQLQFPSLDTTMYSPYCLTQVWKKKIAVFSCSSSLPFSRYGAPPVCFYSMWLRCCVVCRAAAYHLLRFKDLFSSSALFSPIVFNFPLSLPLSRSLSPPFFLMALLQRAFLCVSLRMVWRENGASPKSILYKTEVGKRGRRARCPDSWGLIAATLRQ